MAKDINKKEFTEETKLKLTIFQECFREWYPVFIHHRHIANVLIYDMFAGSGMDTKGNYGSPLILLQEAKGENKQHCTFLSSQHTPQVYFGFNELLSQKEKELESNVTNYMQKCQKTCYLECPFKNHIVCKSADFSTLIKTKNLLQNLEDKNNAKFVLLDQYGFKQIDDTIFTKLISFPKTDFIFFIASSFIKRFRELPAVTNYFHKVKITYDESQPKECHRVITDYFRSLIPTGKEYYLHSFTIQKGKNYYGLIFGTSHSLGMEKFLKVCWKHDKLAGESNCNIENDFEPGTLFYNPLDTNKKHRVLTKIKNKILSRKISNNKQGLKFALKNGCEPSLYVSAISELLESKKIDISGKFNKQATNIHKVDEYTILVK